MIIMTKDSLTRSVAVLGLSALFAVGCGTSTTTSPGAHAPATKSKPPSTSKSTSAAIPCAQAKKLRTSLTDLTKTGFDPTQADKLTKELKDIQSELAALKGQAKGKFADQVSKLNMTITKITADAKNLNSDPAGAIQK